MYYYNTEGDDSSDEEDEFDEEDEEWSGEGSVSRI